MTDKELQEFAVIQTGGKQYKVAVGDVIDIEKLGEYTEGDKIAFDRVIAYDDGASMSVGAPYISDAKVQGLVEAQGPGKKITVRRFRSKSRYHRTYGHRQPFTQVKITSLR